MEILNLHTFSKIVTMREPYAEASLQGNDANPQLKGTVKFYPAAHGSLVVAEVFGLPSEVIEKGAMKPAGPFYAFHVHEGGECGSGSGDDPFAAADSHFNPTNRQHPYHAGDMPPLLGDSGYAYASFFTGRFTPEDIVDRTVMVHAHMDDFKTQPGGNAGMKLACGRVVRLG